jgi:hypothetical protein
LDLVGLATSKELDINSDKPTATQRFIKDGSNRKTERNQFAPDVFYDNLGSIKEQFCG